MIKLHEYLNCLKILRQNNKFQSFNKFIIGNPSADFDSFFGSIIYGYIKYIFFNILYIPLIDCPRSEVPLRFEIVHILKRYQISYQDLYYTQQFPNLKQKTEIILYDHNERQINCQQIIDHHVLKNKECKNVICYKIGSGLSLLYYILNPKEINPQYVDFIQMYKKFGIYFQRNIKYDRCIQQIIRCGILLDSFNLNQIQRGGRWNILDEQAIKNIESRNKQKKLIQFKELQDIKFNIQLNQNLSLFQLYRKDYKPYVYSNNYKIGYSVIYLDPQLFFKKNKFEDVCNYQNLCLIKNNTIQQNFLYKSTIVDTYHAHINLFLYPYQSNYKRQLTIFTKNQQILLQIQLILFSLKMKKIYTLQQLDILFAHYEDPSASISRKTLQMHINSKFNVTKL